MPIPIHILDLGIKSFSQSYSIQRALAKHLIRRLNGEQIQKQITTDLKPQEEEVLYDIYGGNCLIVVQHPSVYTVGLRKEQRPSIDHVNYLRSKGAQYEVTDRGGLITFHGLGQLVAYPVISMKDFNLGMRVYVEKLEKTLIETCARFNVHSNTTKDTGVWIGNNKIGAIGVNARRYVTTHGVSLNVNTDLSWYNHITACGLNDKGTTSLSLETKSNISVDEVIPEFIASFCNTYSSKVISSVDIK